MPIMGAIQSFFLSSIKPQRSFSRSIINKAFQSDPVVAHDWQCDSSPTHYFGISAPGGLCPTNSLGYLWAQILGHKAIVRMAWAFSALPRGSRIKRHSSSDICVCLEGAAQARPGPHTVMTLHLQNAKSVSSSFYHSPVAEGHGNGFVTVVVHHVAHYTSLGLKRHRRRIIGGQ